MSVLGRGQWGGVSRYQEGIVCLDIRKPLINSNSNDDYYTFPVRRPAVIGWEGIDWEGGIMEKGRPEVGTRARVDQDGRGGNMPMDVTDVVDVWGCRGIHGNRYHRPHEANAGCKRLASNRLGCVRTAC
jgi:hypothetical protein